MVESKETNLIEGDVELIFLPDAATSDLMAVYRRAFTNSTELYIVSAYLTHWDLDVPLGSECKTFRLIVGKDFGITRKSACLNVMRWMQDFRRGQFLVADDIDGFHPKAMFWREADGSTYALVGSSNLSRAAFSSNHEINGLARVDDTTFKAAKKWIKQLADKSVVVSESWLDEYVEAVQPRRPGPSKNGLNSSPTVDLTLPLPSNVVRIREVLRHRRQQMRDFKTRRNSLERLFRTAASRAPSTWKEKKNVQFYDDLNGLWFFGDGCRFQGPGWERKGKSSDFREFSISLVRVLDSDEFVRDDVVVSEIDRLSAAAVSTRKALFSEMLCQFFPDQFPVLNNPVNGWLSSTSFSPPARSTEGVRYVDLARKLRTALRRAPSYPAKNLAELDAVIWLASQ